MLHLGFLILLFLGSKPPYLKKIHLILMFWLLFSKGFQRFETKFFKDTQKTSKQHFIAIQFLKTTAMICNNQNEQNT